MSFENDDRSITVLRMVANGQLGTDKTGLFAKFDNIAEEIGNKIDTKDIINFLLSKNFIRKINDKFQKIHNHELEYMAYQITELGKTFLNKHHAVQSFSMGDNVNFAYNSPGASQSINIGDLDDDLKAKVEELYAAIKSNDKTTFKKTLAYIADKSVDVAIALVTGALVK